MIKKKNVYKIIILMLILINLFGMAKVVQAKSQDEIDQEEYDQKYQQGLNDPTANPNSWKPTLEEEPIVFEKAGELLGTINVIGVVCSIIVLIVIGVKYMVGSIEEKAEYKKTIWTYILGMFFLAAATTLPNLIYSIFDGLF